MTHQLNRWDNEHKNFSRLLDALEAQLALLRTEGQPDYELMMSIMDYMTSYTDRIHHPREDIIFAKVAERAPVVRKSVAELANQHREMAKNGKILRARLQNILNDMVESRQLLESEGKAYIAAFRSHMDKEIKEIFPIACRVLSQSDWDRIDAESGPLEADPLATERLGQQYASLRREIASTKQ